MVEDYALGAPGRSDTMLGEEEPTRDVSLDLSEDVSIRPDDVKEAVRQSQVMRAVDIPPDLLDSLAPVVETKPAPRDPAPRPEPRVEARPEPRPEPRVDTRAPEKRAPEPKPPVVVPPPPRQGVSPVLLVLLVVTIVGAGAFFVYKYVLDKPDDDKAETKPASRSTSALPPPEAPKPPPPPPVETQKLATEQPPAIPLKASTPQTLEAFAAKDTVKQREAVAFFVGHTGVEKQIDALNKDIQRVVGELDKAQKALDAAQAGTNEAAKKTAEQQLADRKRSLDDKQKTVGARSAELEKYVLRAPSDGKFVAVAKLNTRVTAADIVASFEPPPVLVATFKKAPNAQKGATATVKAKDGGATASCRVDDVDASGVAKIVCPTDTLKEGQEITLDSITPASKKEGEEIEMGSEESGSSGSAKKAP